MPALERTVPAVARYARSPTQTLSFTGIELRWLRANQDRDRLCRRCAALQIMIGERQQRIGLRIIGADRAYRDTVRFRPEATHDPPFSIPRKRFDLDHVALSDPS